MNSDLFHSKYRIDSARLKNWDYGANAPYFITICTRHKEHFFGSIANDEMTLNGFGSFTASQWEQTPALRLDMNITLAEFVVMPNHFHGILCIGANQFNSQPRSNKFGPQSKNLGSVVGGFKSAVTSKILETDSAFAWQDRYHDHIIRDDEEYQRIRHYIITNPANWMKDKFYK